jgi:hypothetical protein
MLFCGDVSSVTNGRSPRILAFFPKMGILPQRERSGNGMPRRHVSTETAVTLSGVTAVYQPQRITSAAGDRMVVRATKISGQK